MTDQRLRDLVDEMVEQPAEFFFDNYGVTVESDLEFNFRGCKVLMGGNGPTIYLNTINGYIIGTSSSDRYEVHMPDDVCEEVHDFYEMVWNENIRVK